MRVKSAVAPFPVFVSLIGGDHVAPGQEEVEVSYDFEGRVQAVLDNRGYFVTDSYEAKGYEVTQSGFVTTALSPIKVSHRAESVTLAELQEDYFEYCKGFNALEVTRVNNNEMNASHFRGRLHEFGNPDIPNDHYPAARMVSWSGIGQPQRPWKDSYAGVGARAAAPGPGFGDPVVGDLLGADVECTGNPFDFYHADGKVSISISIRLP